MGLGCCGDPPGHPEDIGGADAQTLMLNFPKTQAQNYRLFGPVRPEAEAPLAVLSHDHSWGNVCWEGCGGAATLPVMDISRLQILVNSPCSEFSPGRDWIFSVAWGNWCRKGCAGEFRASETAPQPQASADKIQLIFHCPLRAEPL